MQINKAISCIDVGGGALPPQNWLNSAGFGIFVGRPTRVNYGLW